MVQAKVIEFLLKILSKKRREYEELSSGSLTVRSKAVLALARLSEDISTAAMVTRLGGVEVWLEIVRDTPALDNTGVAMAAMTAAKTITTHCEEGVCIDDPFESFV